MKCSLTRAAIVLAILYLSYNLYVVYTIFNPPSCKAKQKGCLEPAYDRDQKLQVRLEMVVNVTNVIFELQLWLYVSTVQSSFTGKAKLLYHNKSFLRTVEIEQ